MTEIEIYKSIQEQLYELNTSEFDVRKIMSPIDNNAIKIGLPRQNNLDNPVEIYIYPEASNMQSMTFCADKVLESINLWVISGRDPYSAFNEDEDVIYRASCTINSIIKQLQGNRQLAGKSINLHLNSINIFPNEDPTVVDTVFKCNFTVEWLRRF